MQAGAERRADDEAREALVALLLRLVDDYRFGLRDLTAEEFSELVRSWAMLNAGETRAEAVLRIATCSRSAK
jgi:hypothetical protein